MYVVVICALVVTALLPAARLSARSLSAGSSDTTYAQAAQTICVEGMVIDHTEAPLGDGRIVTATSEGTSLTAAVDRNGSFRFQDGLVPGNWTFSIDIQQTDQEWEPVTPAVFDVPLAYGNVGCYKIRFKLRRLITVTVIKIDDNHNRLAGWRIYAEPQSAWDTAKNAITTDDGEAVFRLTPGLWTFSENAPSGVSATPILPENGRQDLTVTAPGPHTIRFKNRLVNDGCIEVLKQDVPPAGSTDTPFPLPGWQIEVRRVDGSVAASGRTGADGRIRFDNLPYGPYVVVEQSRPGWEPATAGSFQVTLSSEQQECVQVVFDNQQVPPELCIEGRKIDTNGKIGLPGWRITAQPLDQGDETPADQITNGLGMYKFTFPLEDYRVPGSTYRICEVAQDGWLPHTPTCYTVRLPKTAGACVRVPDFENQQRGHGRTTVPPAPGTCRLTHTVQRGESLYGLGQRYGVSAQQMINANPWVRNQKKMYLFTGQRLCIP
jgi:hypothetical protein